MYDNNEKFKAGGGTLALGIIGTVGAGLLAAGAGGNGGLLNGGLFGGNSNNMWSDREVSLQRQIDFVSTQQAVTAAVTPYQIKDATCDFVKAEKFMPSGQIVYTQPNYGCNDRRDVPCGFNSGCGCI